MKKEILVRAVKTFIQGFLASLTLSMSNFTNYDETLLKSALIGALAGGISAVMNLILSLLNKGDGNNE